MPRESVTTEKHRASYLGVSETYALNAAVIPVDAVLGDFGYGTYMVGSCLTKKDYRDVDLRFIMKDEEFDRLFSKQRSGLHLLFNVAISEWLQRRTNLPIDFQVQRQTDCNEEFKGHPRNAMGMIEGVNIK